MPSWELFEHQDQAYRDRVLPPAVTARVAVEQASTFGWAHYVGTHGHHHRHDDIRGIRSTESIAEGVRLHEGACCRSRHAATEISEVVDARRNSGREKINGTAERGVFDCGPSGNTRDCSCEIEDAFEHADDRQ